MESQGPPTRVSELVDRTIETFAAALRAHAEAASEGASAAEDSVEGAAVALLRAIREYQTGLAAYLGDDYTVLDSEDLERSYFDPSLFGAEECADLPGEAPRWVLSSEWIFQAVDSIEDLGAEDIRLQLLKNFEEWCKWPFNSPPIRHVELSEYRYRASFDR